MWGLPVQGAGGSLPRSMGTSDTWRQVRVTRVSTFVKTHQTLLSRSILSGMCPSLSQSLNLEGMEHPIGWPRLYAPSHNRRVVQGQHPLGGELIPQLNTEPALKWGGGLLGGQSRV